MRPAGRRFVAAGRNYDMVAALVAERVVKTSGRISAKRLLPAARAVGYSGSPRNFRRMVAAQKQAWRREHHRGRRPAVWSPGEHLVIDWGSQSGLRVFCGVLAWCRVRFVWFAADERAETTLALRAECFEVLGRVPGTVLAAPCCPNRHDLRGLAQAAGRGDAAAAEATTRHIRSAAYTSCSGLILRLIFIMGSMPRSRARRAQVSIFCLRIIDPVPVMSSSCF
jgi:hypothetical protein